MARRAGLLLALLTVAGCGPATDELITQELYVMATRVELTLPSSVWSEQPQLTATIEQSLRQFERDFYAWGDGELNELNRALTAGDAFAASDDMRRVLQNAQRISVLSNGAFDPGVGALVELWGFHTGEPPGSPPTEDRIRQTLGASGSITDLSIDSGRVAPIDPESARTFVLDLGGIAKGVAVDRVAEQLSAAGVTTALINAGGDLRVIGSRPDRNWRIGIAAPRDDGLLGSIELNPGEAAFTSGDYERFFEYDGEWLHHILDPATGYPATHTQAVTVITNDGMTADAAATAVLVAGPDDWRAVAEALGIEAVLRVDAAGNIRMSPQMRERFQPDAGIASDIIVSAD